jgi:hypothetical protein
MVMLPLVVASSRAIIDKNHYSCKSRKLIDRPFWIRGEPQTGRRLYKLITPIRLEENRRQRKKGGVPLRRPALFTTFARRNVAAGLLHGDLLG